MITFANSPTTFTPIPDREKPCATFVTKHYVKELDGAIDIWDTGPLGYDIERALGGASQTVTSIGSITVDGPPPAPS